MDHGTHAGRVFFHDLHGVRSRLPAVDDHRHVFLPGNLQLADKPPLLYIMSGLVPVVIQADLTRRHDLRQIQKRLHPLHVTLRERAGLVRMDADGAVYEGILLCQLHDPVPGFQRGTCIYDQSDAAPLHLPEQRRPVGVKLFIVIMCVCINYHFPFSPSAHGRASGQHLHRQLHFQDPRLHSGPPPLRWPCPFICNPLILSVC